MHFPGNYVLKADYFPDRPVAIKVYCDDVSIDLNGFSLGVKASDGLSIGIRAIGVRRLSVHDGTVTQCDIGLHADDSDEVMLNKVAFDGVRFMGVDRARRGLTIRNCRFTRIAGYKDEAYAIGVNAPGDDALIEACDFRNLDRQPDARDEQKGEGVGVVVATGNRNVLILQNRFENEPADNPVSIGVFVSTDASAQIVNNTMINIPHAVGSQAAVVVKGNVCTMRYSVRTAIAVHLVPGSVVEGNTFIGYSHPKLSGITARHNQLQTSPVEPLSVMDEG